jgi:hypothetical protein
VADDELLWTAKPPTTVRQRKPGEPIWSLRKNGRQVDCELRFHGESYGWECQCLYDGDLAYGQRFVLRVAPLSPCRSNLGMKFGVI